ncbi:LacI family DNA-binding transcriptional regulator [Peribacillus simplex]|uniref:LacI family DNA-binding transcriptional regulator n=1 Tax=Peribacillus simplex TaxID=1478 RepID=UPI0007776ACA|nr:LacI family DNA-binding transcriptional regulator [Peribacillus simplex]AMM94431.1 NTD biosynthesis operon regulator NtdR [Peribacillus simplex]MDM5293268.1 LacI family DNA-binding transcriptional regulator [Peribacillus simplex]
MTKISEIAKLCNVSKTTVSRVLNNHPYVSKEKREQILKVIKELDYVPSSLARNFRTNKTKTIAILVPRFDHPFFAQLIKGVSLAALENDYKVLIFQTFYDSKNELDIMERLKNREVDGVILGALENEWNLIKPYLTYGPILLCNEYHYSAPIPIIGYDELEATYKAVDHLIKKGHKKIGFCYDTSYSQAQSQRKEGFLKALADNNLLHNEDWIFGHGFNIEDGFRICDEIFKLKEKPTALFTGNDQVAAGIIKRATALDYKIPEYLAIVGYDNQSICQVTTPTITTIDIPIMELGQRSAIELIKYLNNDLELKRDVIKLPTKLKIREST